jgi:hypothetical protein
LLNYIYKNKISFRNLGPFARFIFSFVCDKTIPQGASTTVYALLDPELSRYNGYSLTNSRSHTDTHTHTHTNIHKHARTHKHLTVHTSVQLYKIDVI